MGTACCKGGNGLDSLDLEELKRSGGFVVLVREAVDVPGVASFQCRVGPAGSSYEAKCAKTERLSNVLSAATQWNYSAVWARSSLPPNAELHIRFFSGDFWTAGTPIGEARVSVKELEARKGKYATFPIAGTSGSVVLMTGPGVEKVAMDHLAELMRKEEGTGNISNEFWLLAAASLQFFATTEDRLSVHLTLLSLATAALSSPTGEREWFLERSRDETGQDTYVWKGPRAENCTCYSGYEDVTRLLKGLGDKLGTDNTNGSAYRINSLGMTNFFSGAMWPELAPNGMIALGQNQENHAFLRKYAAAVVSDEGEGRWTTPQIRAAAKAFWKDRTTLSVPSDLSIWVTQVLHKIMFGLDISWDDGAAFMEMQGKILVGTVMPEGLIPVLGIDAALREKADRMARYKPAVQATFPDAKFTEFQLTLLTSATLDALMFAGGASIPLMLSYCLAMIYSTWGRENLPAGFQLKKSILTRYAYEVVRRFPPVNGVCWMEKSEGLATPDQLIFVNLCMASRDPRVWGSEPDKFRLRSLEEYHKLHIAWGEPAVAPANSSPNSHKCPAKQLSLVMITEFLTAFLSATLGEAAVEKDAPFDPASWTCDTWPDFVNVNELTAGPFKLTRA